MDQISSIVQAGILRPEGGLPGKGGLAGLKVGDVLTALVLEKADTGEVLLSLGGEKITARTETSLLPGDRVSLRVEDLAGTVVLKLVSKEAPDARQVSELIRGRIPQSMNVGEDYSELRSALKDLLQKSPSLREGPLGALLGRLEQVLPDKEASPAKLKAFVENSGIFYERKLAAAVTRETGTALPAGLKPLILEAKTSAQNALASNPALREDLDRFLDLSDKVLKNADVVKPSNTLLNREGARAAGMAEDAAKGGEVIKGKELSRSDDIIKGSPSPRADRFLSDLREVASTLIDKAPALKKGPLGELLVRLEQATPREETPTGRPDITVKGEEPPVAHQRSSTGKNVETAPAATDLKALILDAKETAKTALERHPALRGELDKFLDVSERVLKNTEIVQLANSLMGATENTFWAVLPYVDGERADSVDWEVRRGGTDDEGSEALSFSLTFDLSGLGKVKVDGLFGGNRLHCSFWSQDEETARFMGDHLDEFSRSVSLKGMDVGNLACGVSRGASETPLQRSMKSAGVRLVDRQA